MGKGRGGYDWHLHLERGEGFGASASEWDLDDTATSPVKTMDAVMSDGDNNTTEFLLSKKGKPNQRK
jgi:hypothetical protein